MMSFLQWIKDMFGQLGEVKTTQGPLHNYLGMTIDYSRTCLYQHESLCQENGQRIP